MWNTIIWVLSFLDDLPSRVASGITAKIVDEQDVNNGDIIKIVLLETDLILALLLALTKYIEMPIYIMATILLSFVSALGLGVFLVDELLGFESISPRVPIYLFIHFPCSIGD
ncbi:hypothetical protein AF332_14145 [Sporosarcina globispora]|uniref:Membrane transport protein MMPL domain-containing protein n=1 Tax=Sporosarcina globispora TaxID=1459 RepID=A0A0M0GDC2_SPOGL|nr:hypothetical protein AF332_14145 [Sporosarcina globispora]